MIIGKGTIHCYKQLLLLPQCVQEVELRSHENSLAYISPVTNKVEVPNSSPGSGSQLWNFSLAHTFGASTGVVPRKQN